MDFTIIAIVIQYIMLSVYILYGAFFLQQYFVQRKQNENPIDIYYAVFFISLFIGQIFHFYFTFYATGAEMKGWDLPENILIWKLGSGFMVIGFGMLIFEVEKRIFQGRDYYLFILAYSVLVIIGLFQPKINDSTNWIMYALIFSTFIPIAYGYIASKSMGDVRKKALIIVLAFCVFFVGVILLGQSTTELIVQAGIDLNLCRIIAYCFRIAGASLFFMGFKSLFR